MTNDEFKRHLNFELKWSIINFGLAGGSLLCRHLGYPNASANCVWALLGVFVWDVWNRMKLLGQLEDKR